MRNLVDHNILMTCPTLMEDVNVQTKWLPGDRNSLYHPCNFRFLNLLKIIKV